MLLVKSYTRYCHVVMILRVFFCDINHAMCLLSVPHELCKGEMLLSDYMQSVLAESLDLGPSVCIGLRCHHLNIGF